MPFLTCFIVLFTVSGLLTGSGAESDSEAVVPESLSMKPLKECNVTYTSRMNGEQGFIRRNRKGNYTWPPVEFVPVRWNHEMNPKFLGEVFPAQNELHEAAPFYLARVDLGLNQAWFWNGDKLDLPSVIQLGHLTEQIVEACENGIPWVRPVSRFITAEIIASHMECGFDQLRGQKRIECPKHTVPTYLCTSFPDGRTDAGVFVKAYCRSE